MADQGAPLESADSFTGCRVAVAAAPAMTGAGTGEAVRRRRCAAGSAVRPQRVLAERRFGAAQRSGESVVNAFTGTSMRRRSPVRLPRRTDGRFSAGSGRLRPQGPVGVVAWGCDKFWRSSSRAAARSVALSVQSDGLARPELKFGTGCDCTSTVRGRPADNVSRGPGLVKMLSAMIASDADNGSKSPDPMRSSVDASRRPLSDISAVAVVGTVELVSPERARPDLGRAADRRQDRSSGPSPTRAHGVAPCRAR